MISFDVSRFVYIFTEKTKSPVMLLEYDSEKYIIRWSNKEYMVKGTLRVYNNQPIRTFDESLDLIEELKEHLESVNQETLLFDLLKNDRNTIDFIETTIGYKTEVKYDIEYFEVL